jgi:hypothetical protein
MSVDTKNRFLRIKKTLESRSRPVGPRSGPCSPPPQPVSSRLPSPWVTIPSTTAHQCHRHQEDEVTSTLHIIEEAVSGHHRGISTRFRAAAARSMPWSRGHRRPRALKPSPSPHVLDPRAWTSRGRRRRLVGLEDAPASSSGLRKKHGGRCCGRHHTSPPPT